MKKCNCGGGSDSEFAKPSIPVPANQTQMIASAPVSVIKEKKTSERILPFFSDEIFQLFILGGIATAIILIVIKKC